VPTCLIHSDIESSNASNSSNTDVLDAQSLLVCPTHTDSLTSSVNVENDRHSLNSIHTIDI